MSGCTRSFFICNGLLKPLEEFEKCFAHLPFYLYEVFRVQQGIAVFVEEHIERLWNTAELEKVVLPFKKGEIFDDIQRLIRFNPQGDGNVKVVINATEKSVNRLIYFTPHQYPTPEQYTHGVALGFYYAERNNPNAKVMDVSLREATELMKSQEHLYEVLLIDGNGFITEGSRSNVFFIRNGFLITPPVETVLEGITRKQIIRICNKHHIAIAENRVHHSELENMDAIFISGTSRRVLPVAEIAGLYFNAAHPLIRRMQALFEEHVNDYLKSHHTAITRK